MPIRLEAVAPYCTEPKLAIAWRPVNVAARSDQATCSVNDEERRAGSGMGAMRFRVIGHLIADSGPELKASPVTKLSLHLAGEAEKDVTLLAPMVGPISRRVFDHANANWSELLGAPDCHAGLTWVLG